MAEQRGLLRVSNIVYWRARSAAQCVYTIYVLVVFVVFLCGPQRAVSTESVELTQFWNIRGNAEHTRANATMSQDGDGCMLYMYVCVALLSLMKTD